MNILITGMNSYVGSNVGEFLTHLTHDVHYISLKDSNRKNRSFKGFNCIFHVAGIAHVPSKSVKHDHYNLINHELTVELAKKAKMDGVHHFIFMSSIMVYGNQSNIEKHSKPTPNNAYGLSKYQAEVGLLELQSKTFNITIVRAPMIYGYKSKGNFDKLRKLALHFPIFPLLINQRSMLYIENLNVIIAHIIEQNIYGVVFPQNPDYSSTYSIVESIRRLRGKKTLKIRLFNPLLRLIARHNNTMKKLFGDLYYSWREFEGLNLVSLEESLRRIEKQHES